MNLDMIQGIADSVVANQGGLNRSVKPNSVLQYDADFACYEVADLEISAKHNFPALLDYLHHKRELCGCQYINCFVTLGSKTARDEMATVKPYQYSRDPNVPIKVRVRELREMLIQHKFVQTDTLRVVHHPLYEADDLMCIYQNKMIAAGKGDLSTIASGDKDLWIPAGWHASPKTGRLTKYFGYGHTEYREVGNVKPKLVGEGTSWFWHQMIMGDTADGIPGLEKICNSLLDELTPLKTGKKRKDGAGLCGEGKAVLLLDGVNSETRAASVVADAYKRYYGGGWHIRMFEQAYLLWMQRTWDSFDVLYYLRDECGLSIQPSAKQLEIISKFNKSKEL